MSFIRRDAADGVRRWREAGIAMLVLGWGLWWGITGLGFIRILGWVILVIGAALTVTAIQRARFRAGHGGLGVVEVDERQVAYLAPVGGGMVSIEVLDRVSVGPDRAGLPVWKLMAGGETLTIPASASGTEALFDVLTVLPGAHIEAAIRATRGRPVDTTVIWQRAPGTAPTGWAIPRG